MEFNLEMELQVVIGSPNSSLGCKMCINNNLPLAAVLLPEMQQKSCSWCIFYSATMQTVGREGFSWCYQKSIITIFSMMSLSGGGCWLQLFIIFSFCLCKTFKMFLCSLCQTQLVQNCIAWETNIWSDGWSWDKASINKLKLWESLLEIGFVPC